jgi:hypothetical protein
MSSFSFVRIPSRTSPKGKHHEAQGWPRFLRPTLGRGAGLQSTLKGLCKDATPSGLDLHESTTQGRRHKSPPTLGSEMLPFQGSYEFGKSNLDKLGLQPRSTWFTMNIPLVRFQPGPRSISIRETHEEIPSRFVHTGAGTERVSLIR